MSSGSSGLAGFIVVHSGCRLGVTCLSRVHPGSMGSFWCALGIVEFIRGRWVACGAYWGSLGSSGAAGFIGVRPCGSLVHQGSLG